MNIGFLGAGNMGGAILRGFYASKKATDNIFVFGVNHEKLEKTCAETGATPCTEIEDLVEKCDLFLIGVKPNIFPEVLPKIKKAYTNDKICVSMAAGVSIAQIESYLGDDATIVRIMPNTPAQVREAMTSVSCNKNVTEEQLAPVMEILQGIGKAEIVDEELIHTVIGVSGSAPAYTYMYIDGLIKAAIAEGMDPEKAKVFAAQGVLGAAKMVLENDITPEELRIKVCSPGGTTIQAVEKLMELDFEDIVGQGFRAASDKSRMMEK